VARRGGLRSPGLSLRIFAAVTRHVDSSVTILFQRGMTDASGRRVRFAGDRAGLLP